MSGRMLSLAAAAATSGVPVETLRTAIRRKSLEASKVSYSAKKQGRMVWAIEKSELDRFMSQSPPEPKKPWTEADHEAIRELQESCTDAQLAAYLGRPVNALVQYLWKARKRGLLDRRENAGTYRVPFRVPKTAILIAKSCAKCGKMRDASYFRQYTSGRIEGNHDAWCQICNLSEGKRNYAKLKERDPSASTNNSSVHKFLQKVTEEHADRSNMPYTMAEMDEITDVEKSTLEVALNLGRTFYAIRARRYINGVVDQRFSDVFVHNKRRKKLPDSHWTIHFPAAAKALREHFIKLGEAVPEELWEWNDTEEIAS
jgi:hypothetical protein